MVGTLNKYIFGLVIQQKDTHKQTKVPHKLDISHMFQVYFFNQKFRFCIIFFVFIFFLLQHKINATKHKKTDTHTHIHICTKKKDGTTTCFKISLASVSKTYNAFANICEYCNYPNSVISLFMNAHAVVSKTDSSGNVIQTETAWYHPFFFILPFYLLFLCLFCGCVCFF